MAEGGAPTAWPRVSPAAKRLIELLLQQDPLARPTAEAALQDPWMTGDYDSAAVRATIATLRTRFLGWSQLQPSVDAPSSKPVPNEPAHRPLVPSSRPRQIDSSLMADTSAAAALATPKLSFGHLSRWLMGRFGKRRHLKVLLLGLDSAGKSTLVARLKQDAAPEPTVPTIGYDVEHFEHADVVYALYDVGGQRQSRAQWRQHLTTGAAWSQSGDGVGGIIFVVDAADPTRWEEARKELHLLLEDRALQTVPLLVLANKKDLPSAGSVDAVTEGLQIDRATLQTRGARYAVQAVSTLQGSGVLAALEWIAANTDSQGSAVGTIRADPRRDFGDM